MSQVKTYTPQFITSHFDPQNAKDVKKKFAELEARQSQSTAELEQWLLQWEELSSLIQDRYSRIHVATTINTADAQAQKDFLTLVEEVLPIVEEETFKLNQKFLNDPHRSNLDQSFYKCFIRFIESDIKIFRQENIPLKTEERKLVNEFEKIMGSLMVSFRGQDMTMQQAAKFLEEADEATRKEAYTVRAQARLAVADELNELYDQMLSVREQIAHNAGFHNFRDYQFASYHRFDYSPKDCEDFHVAIEKHIVPLVQQLYKERCLKLKASTLKPWNLSVDPEQRPPLCPFEQVDKLIEGCRRIFHKVDRELGTFFDHMISARLLDLESRKGKAPGGYMTQFTKTREPFIFMNAVGTKRDVETLLHEGGHAFHYFLARDIALSSYHSTGLEFAEVASMSMELLARPYLNEFYNEADCHRVLEDQLHSILEFFPFMAMIDAFQHWVYTRPHAPTAVARAQKWAELESRFRHSIDWSGHEDIRNIGWQYPHVFSVPFYYVEYGIAQLGALAVWAQSLTNHGAAVVNYKKGLKLGASCPLPILFQTVGARFGMSSEIIAPLVSVVQNELMKS